MQVTRSDLRNIAIIAHVDHGKTTLVDGLLRQAQVFRANQQVIERVLDSNDLERERGITILAKNTAVHITDPETGKQVKINIVDTPGHADFGGEVERVLNMVDGVLLLVDAAEGPRPQTRFVLKKALELGHRAIVVINKVDRKDADTDRVLNETFDLFIELGATDEQAEFAVVYAVATTQKAGLTPEIGPDLKPLFDTILKEIPAPVVDLEAPLQMLVTTLDYDNYRGLTAIGRIFSGAMKVGQIITRLTASIAGLDGIAIGETLADADNPIALPAITVEKPTVRMSFGVNTSPFSGREGRWSTSRKLRERLFNELKSNVSLRVEETDSVDTFIVSGRGELHLAILIETIRREGFEFQVSRPEVILRPGPDGKMQEPYEEVHIETSQETSGAVISMLGKRRAEMTSMIENSSGSVQLIFIVPSRGILGFRHHFLTATRGVGIMNTIFHGYGSMAGSIETSSHGSLIAWETGSATTFGLKNAEGRGALFIAPGFDVYAGMVVGENQRPDDLEVNICKTKHLTNMRNAIRDIEVRLAPRINMSLDECIEYLSDDEFLEVTPENLRIRKRILAHHIRGRAAKRAKEAVA